MERMTMAKTETTTLERAGELNARSGRRERDG